MIQSLIIVPAMLVWTGQASAGNDIWFEDRADAAGIDFRHVSDHNKRHLMPEIMGGGVALTDVDGDGDIDLYLVQSGSLMPLFALLGDHPRLFTRIIPG